jgi:hypothetical protein
MNVSICLLSVKFIRLTKPVDKLYIVLYTDCQDHRLNMELELQSLFGFYVQVFSLAETPRPQLPPFAITWAHIRERYWSAKIDDISL